LEKIHSGQRLKMKRYKSNNEKLNEQAIHFEIMINKMRPELLNSRMKKEGTGEGRIELSKIPDEGMEESIVKDILREKGIIKEGQKTIFDFIKRNSKGEMVSSMESLNDRIGKENSDNGNSSN
jgi:hypothetical protein